MLTQWLFKLTSKPRRQRRRLRQTYRPTAERLESRELFAANLFVATTGNDNNGRGTIDAPYATLAKSLAVAQPGDTVVLRGGTYAGGVRVDDANVTIRSFDNEWAIVKAPITDENIETVIRFNSNASGGKLQRLEIEGGYFYGVKLDGGEDPADRRAATGVIIEDSRIHDTGRDAIKITPGCDDVIIRRNEIFNSGRRDNSNAEGIDNVNGDRMIVVDNHIHDIATNGLYAKGGSIGTVIEGNLIRNTGGSGILFGFRDTDAEWFDTTVNPDYYENIDGVMRNNIIVNTAFAGIGLYGAKNPTIVNNTLIDVAQSGQAAFLIDTSETYITDDPLLVPSQNVKFVNNIVKLSSTSDRPAFEIRIGGLVGTLQTTANRYFHSGASADFRDRRVGREFNGGLASWQSHLSGDLGSSEGNPRLDANYHLVSGSPCIDAGNSSFTVMHDYDNNLRSGPRDIGADEFNAGAILQVPPPPGVIGKGSTFQSSGPKVGFSVASSNGSESVTSVRLAVSLSAASTQTVTVAYRVNSGTAKSGSDFAPSAGTLTFAPGQTVAFVSLVVINDSLDEDNETVNVALSSPVNADLGSIQSHVYTIQDNDATPTVKFLSAGLSLNESASNAATFVRLSAASGRPVTVAYRVVRGTATNGADYRISNGTITFQPGQVQQSIPFTIVDDLRDESNENFVLALSNPTNAAIGNPGSHVVTIVDNDSPPLISFQQPTSTINEAAGAASVNVTLSAPSSQTVRVSYLVVPDTARGGGVDYSGDSGTVTFEPGQTVKSVRISITNDSRVEANETLSVHLLAPNNATLGAVSSHTVTIVDNDTPATTSQTMIAFRLPDGHVYRIAPEAGAKPVDITLGLNQLSPGTQDDNLSVSPDGRWLAMITDRFGIGSDWTGLAVVSADLSSGEAVRVGGQIIHPEGAVAVGSGGNVVVYSSADGPHVRDLWAATKSNGVWTAKLLTANSPFDYNSQPAISADGTKVLFNAGNQPHSTGSQAIGEVRVDGTNFRQVVTNALRPSGANANGAIHHADYAPDDSIIFEADWTGEQIWRLSPGATRPIRVSNASNENSPCVLSDGRIVSLWLNRPGNRNGLHELTVRSADGTYLFTLLSGSDVQDIGISCGG